jgi:hypothetical protein
MKMKWFACKSREERGKIEKDQQFEFLSMNGVMKTTLN